jgi:hypothetical protein
MEDGRCLVAPGEDGRGKREDGSKDKAEKDVDRIDWIGGELTGDFGTGDTEKTHR